jgi:hypothetical protein
MVARGGLALLQMYRYDLRQSRDCGLARAHLQQMFVAVVMNLVRVIT